MAYVWLVCVATCLSIVSNSFCTSEDDTIYCNFETESSALSNCFIQDTRDFLWPNEAEATSPPPSSLTTSWYRNKRNRTDSEVIEIKLTWTQETTHFESFVQGYILSVSMTDANGEEKQLITFRNKTRLLTKTTDSSNYLSFTYEEFGKNSKFGLISPGSIYFFKLFSLPLYHDNTNAGYQWTLLRIPTCNSTEEIYATKNCAVANKLNSISNDEEKSIEKAKNKTIKDTVKQNSNKNAASSSTSAAMVLIITLLISIILTVVVVVLFRGQQCLGNNLRRFKSKKDVKRKKSVLFVVDLSNKDDKMAYYEVAGRLASILNEHGSVEVRCNLWEKSTINDNQLWLMKNTQDVDHVVLFCDPLVENSCLPDLVDSFFSFQIHKSNFKNQQIHNTNCSIVSCKKSKNFTTGSNYQFYELMKDFDTFFKALTGRKAKNNIPSFTIQGIQEAVALLNSISNDVHIDQSVQKGNDATKLLPLLSTIC